MSDPKATTQNVFCTPIDVIGDDTSDPYLQDIAMVTLDDATDPVASGMIRMVLNFTAFIVMLLIVGFGMPYIYNVFIFEFIKNGCKLLNESNADVKKNKVYAAVFNFFIFIIVVSILLFLKYTDANQLIVAMFTVIFGLVSGCVLYLHITSKETAAETVTNKTEDDKIYLEKITTTEILGNILKFIPSVSMWSSPNLMIFIVALIICFLMIFLPFYFTGLYDKNVLLFSFLTYSIPVYLANFIATMSTPP